MRFYPRKTPRKKADVLIDKIASGKGDDLVISELKAAVTEIAEPEELQRISWAVLDIAMNSTSMAAVGYALKSMVLFMPMAEDIENALDNRVLTLVEDKSAVSNKVLIEAMAGYARERVAGDVDRSVTFIPAMLLFLEESNGAAASISYEVLMNAASYRPEFFEPYAGLLTRELGSINNSTRIYTARIITKIARAYPEYVAEAEKTLLHISTFYPDAEVKSAAAEAYQTITQNRGSSQPEPELATQPKHDSTGGLADIMRKKASSRDKKQNSDSRIDNRLLSLAANFARKSDMRNGQAQSPGTPRGKGESRGHEADNEAMDKIIDDFSEIAGVITGNHNDEEDRPAEEKISKEEAELRDMVAKVQVDFSESAESLLDSLGMKHLQKDQPAESPEAAGIEPGLQEIPEAGAAVGGSEVGGSEVGGPETSRTTEAMPDSNDDYEFISSIEKKITESDSSRTEDSPGTVPTVAAQPEIQPALARTEAVPEDAKPIPETTVAVPVAAAPEQVPDTLNTPAQTGATEAPAAPNKVLPPYTPRATKSPVIPEGVRISAVKFKTLDLSKKPQPPSKVSIKPHIKPLNRTPRDISKIVQQRPQQAAVQQADATPASQTDAPQKVESTVVEPTVCPSCNEKIVGDQQYCLKCGTDLKSMKVRCTRCSQINARDTGTCVRCGAKLVRGPAAAKQPDVL